MFTYINIGKSKKGFFVCFKPKISLRSTNIGVDSFLKQLSGLFKSNVWFMRTLISWFTERDNAGNSHVTGLLSIMGHQLLRASLDDVNTNIYY